MNNSSGKWKVNTNTSILARKQLPGTQTQTQTQPQPWQLHKPRKNHLRDTTP